MADVAMLVLLRISVCGFIVQAMHDDPNDWPVLFHVVAGGTMWAFSDLIADRIARQDAKEADKLEEEAE